MRILLLNDNPVVRKLVALSAQKTKDDLNVVSSVDEIEYNTYDLLIVDDALYRDDVMATLKEKITFKISLLMATRGNAVPEGFSHVINKPFLPTDLVELFVGIENNLEKTVILPLEDASDNLPAIDLDSMLKGLENKEELDTLQLDDEFDFEEPSRGSDELDDTITTNVLDHEEVQELQELLDDTDDEIKISALTEEEGDDDLLGALDDFDMEDDALLSEIEDFKMEEESLGELDDLSEKNIPSSEEILEDDFDDLGVTEKEGEPLEEMMLDDEAFDDLESIEDEEVSLSDEDFDDLELQIKKATGELGLEDLELELEDIHHDELDSDDFDVAGEMDMLDGLDGFEGINERDMKLALGEKVEEESSVAVQEDLSLELAEIEEPATKSKPLRAAVEENSSPAQGVEALQALLKALSNDEVVKSLKGLNISININFGETK